MTESLPGIQRPIATAIEAPTRPNRPDLAPAEPAEGRPGVEPVVEPALAQAPLLITEQQVILGTAAALRVPKKKQWIALLRPRRARSTAHERAAKHRHYPHHYGFVEQALMAREMDRL